MPTNTSITKKQSPKTVKSTKSPRSTKSPNNQTGGEVSCSSKFDYDAIKIGKNMNQSRLNVPPPPPTDCNIL